VLPLAISNGAGSASQHAIGTGVIGGMLTATFLAIFMIPMFFVVISKFSKAKDVPAPGSDGNIEGPNGGSPSTGKEGH
jgi:multidrug efflux pump